MGDASTLGRVGKILFGRLFLTSLITGTVAGGILSLTVSFDHSVIVGDSSQLSALFQMILGIIPSNFFNAFLQGNSLQIVFMAAAAGIILIKLRSTSYSVISLVDQGNEIFQTLLALINSLIPGFVFVSITNLILSDDLSKLGNIWLLAATFFATLTALIAIQFVEVLLSVKLSPLKVLRKLSTPFLICVSTASSAAAFPASIECCEKKLGIDKTLIKVGLPLGIIVFRPGLITILCTSSVFFANAYDVPITASGFAMMLITAVLLASAAPPVPGGGIACYTLLFRQVGIPLEALPLAIAIDIVADFITTATNVSVLHIQLLHAAKKLGMLDKEILRKV
jgi:Na+/H+-dicarboxylate symporter